MPSNSSTKLVTSWKDVEYKELQQEEDINRELERFILDVLRRNEFVRYCNICAQFTDLDCGREDRVDCAKGIFHRVREFNRKTPDWFSDIVQERAQISVKTKSRINSNTFLEGETL